MQETITEIKNGKKTLAICFSKKLKADGVKFLTPLHYPLQIGLIEHKNGKMVPGHIHRDLKYNVNTTQEFLYVEKGKIEIEIFTKKWKKICAFKMTKGDFVLFVNGGHSVNIHKDSRIIEVKQGPYPGDKKAKIFQKLN